MSEQPVTPNSPRSVAPEDAGRIDPSRKGRLILLMLALVLYSEIAPMQLAAVSIIVPKIAPSFPAAGDSITWAVTIVGVAGGATMALLGKLGDKLGKKNVTLICGLLFLIGALLCVLTSSWPLFLLGRALGGASWAMTALEYGLVRDLIPRKWVPVAVGVVGTGFGIGGVVTPIVVGALTDHYSWRSVFWFLVIYTAVTTPVLLFGVPESPVRAKQRFDILGAVLFGAGVGLALIYVSMGSTWGWANIGSLAYLIGGVVALVAFVGWELKTPAPMLELKLLRAPKVAIPLTAAFMITLSISVISLMVAYMFETPTASVLKGKILAGAAAQGHTTPAVVSQFMTFHGDLSYANGYSVLSMALHITIWSSLFGMIFGVVGGWLCRKVGSRIPLIAAGAALLIGTGLWAQWHSTWQEQVAIGVFYGIAFGFYFAAGPNLIMDAVPATRQGVTAGMLAVFGSVGQSVGAAAFTAIAAAYPFEVIATNPLTHQVTTTAVAQVYSNTAYSLSYIVLGVVPGALVVLMAIALRQGKQPARGGAPEAAPAEAATAAA